MKNLRMMLACLAIGSGTALGCAFETSSEPETTSESTGAANQGEEVVQATSELATYWYQRANAFIKQGEAGNLRAFDDAKDALRRCIDKDPNFTECFRLMAIVNLPRPGCLTCAATGANVRAPKVPTLATSPQTPEPKAPTSPELLLAGERIDGR